MKVAVVSAKPYDQLFLSEANAGRHDLVFLKASLNLETASLAQGHDAVCPFVNDELPEAVLEVLAKGGVRLIALRCAGFNNVDVQAAARLGMRVARVPAYSPHAVAEHTLALMLCLNRKIHRAYNRVRDGNFALDGLLGFDFFQKTAAVVGTGKIGLEVCRILKALGCRVLAYDPFPNPDVHNLGIPYAPLAEIFAQADILTLHCPLTSDNYHLIGAPALAAMKPGVMIVNTGRGALIDAGTLIEGLKSGRVGALGLDVYEEEAGLFFEDRSGAILHDDTFARLLTFPNVLITGHQAFFTEEALRNIAAATLANIDAFAQSDRCPHEVSFVPQRT
jgi:D-lactate dehydrogenase